MAAAAIVFFLVNQLTEILKNKIGEKVNQVGEEVRSVIEVETEIRHISSELTTIRNVLEDAEKRGYKEKAVQGWLQKLEDVARDIGDVLDEWNYELLKLQIEGLPENVVVPKPNVSPFIPSSSSLCIEKITCRHDIANKIKEVKKRLDVILKEKDKYDFIMAEPPRVQSDRIKTTSFVDVSEIQGRDADRDALVSKLINIEGTVDQEERGRPRVISLVGAGGIGKTTLAQLVYNHDLVKNCFEKRIWICVSDVSDEVKIVKGIIEQVKTPSEKDNSSNLNEMVSLLKFLVDTISGKKFLLVLDDVWEEYSSSDKWAQLKICLKSCGGPGSKILLTTRNEVVAKQMGTTKNEVHHLGVLSHEDCWLLMSRIAFFDRGEEECAKLQDIARNIANKCKGLPLAAKVLGSLLRFKENTIEWENVLNSEIWQLKEVEVELFPHLYLSYNELSPAMKLCFSYCAVFPKDFEIDVEDLKLMWMAQGYLSSEDGNVEDDLERRGNEYYGNLKVRSFFQDFGKSLHGKPTCKMHDIVHDFAQFLRRNIGHNNREDPNGRDGTTAKELSQACDPSLVSQIKIYRTLICKDNLPVTHLYSVLRVLQSEIIPIETENLTQLRYLAVYHRERTQLHIPQTIFKLYNMETLYLGESRIQEIPKEIGNLIKLRHLDLSGNADIIELPKTIYNLRELRTLNLQSCSRLERIHEGIEKLVNLKHFINRYTVLEFPQGLSQLTGLETLNELSVGRGSYNSKLGYLKRLNKLSGDLTLGIKLDDDDTEEDRKMMIEEAQNAELGNKIHIQHLTIAFLDRMGRTREEESMRNDIMEALQPHPNLSSLSISGYEGKKFPGWMMSCSTLSSLYHLKRLNISFWDNCTGLPPLGKLPYLEVLEINKMESLELVGREFLGLTSLSLSSPLDASQASSSSSSSTTHVITCFPKLKKLSISSCKNWEEWEDITTAEEEERAPTLSIMPCLRELSISYCSELKRLPLRLLRKASSLQHLKIWRCKQLYERYREEWKSLLSHIKEGRVR